MACLETPPPTGSKVKNIADFLNIVGEWQRSSSGSDDGFLSQFWYRGVNRPYKNQAPGVYRDAFTNQASQLKSAQGNLEDKRLQLEREMISQFRSAGASFMQRNSLVEIYFTAQHFGMPTRLLDWSTNPLPALLFACDGQPEQDGFVYAMDARKVIPPGAMRNANERLYQSVMTMRNPLVESAVGLSFWVKPKEDCQPHILPVRPDIVPGRIGQQGSCFTLHMHNAKTITNPSMITIIVDASSKDRIKRELHQLNINEFTIYNDLDHLSKEIKKGFGLQ